jgi:hypothetical protein
MSKAELAMVKCNSMIEGEIVKPLVMGSTGETYHGREVVVFKHTPGLFGTRKEGKERIHRFTLHNGLVNQCSLQDTPTPYWAVLDSMIDCKANFARKDVIEKAVKIVGEDKRKACEMAWDVLRNHQRHARKCNAGMAYMIDSISGGKLSIRARSDYETLQYFEGEATRRKTAEQTVNSEEIPAPVSPATTE